MGWGGCEAVVSNKYYPCSHHVDLEFVPSLRFHTPNTSVITWAGMWALQENKKEVKGRAATNGLRGARFDEAAKRCGIKNQIPDTGYRHQITPKYFAISFSSAPPPTHSSHPPTPHPCCGSSVMAEWGVTYLPLREMTSPRSDLRSDGVHYSWPVSLATLELWLGSICPPSSGWEPDSDRC